MEKLDLAGVQALERRFHEAVAAEDIAGIVAMYAEDAVVLPAGGAAIRGREEIKAFWTAGIKLAAGVKLNTTEVQPLGPGVVQEMGEITMGSGVGGPRTKYLIIWRKIGPQWLLQTDMWNTDS